jgi:hypothetical protein
LNAIRFEVYASLTRLTHILEATVEEYATFEEAVTISKEEDVIEVEDEVELVRQVQKKYKRVGEYANLL